MTSPAADPFSLNALSAGSHTITVRATLSGVGSTTSATFTVGTTLPPDTTPPSAPTNLTRTALTSTSATFSWTAATDDRPGPLSYDMVPAAGGTPLTTGITTTSVTVSGLSPNTAYSLAVRARDAAGNLGLASTSASFTTLPSATTTTTTTTTTTAPPSTVDPLKVSMSAIRSSSTALNGAALPASGQRYIFLANSQTYRQVTFWIDNPTRSGNPARTDTTAPYDLVGGNVFVASPFSLATLPRGQHTITAVATTSSGAMVTSSATFTIG